MSNISHDGHRQRIRASYIANGIENMPDHNVLELLLSISIPRKDVKPIAYDLINRFGSLEKVFSAHPAELMQVSGIGEQTAVLISLVKDINRKINLNKNKSVTRLCSTSEACVYFERILEDLEKECVVVTTVDNSNRVIRTHFVGSGSVNFSKINKREIIELILRDNASGVFVAHNHPGSGSTPSAADLDFTVSLLGLLRNINVKLLDHVIVGQSETLSMRHQPRYMLYFEDSSKTK